MATTDNSDIFKWAAGFIATVFIQVTVLKFIAIEVQPNISVQPDLVLLLLFFFGLHFSPNLSSIAGFLSGLTYDIFSGGIIGLSAFTKTISGFIIGYLPRMHKLQKLFHFLILLFTVVLIHDLVYNAIFVINTEINYFRLVLLHSIPSSFYTVFIGVIVFYWKK